MGVIPLYSTFLLLYLLISYYIKKIQNLLDCITVLISDDIESKNTEKEKNYAYNRI